MSSDDSGLLDAPNQQVVRPDGSAPWEEGEGGSTSGATPKTRGAGGDLDDMTKEELLEHAQQLEVVPANKNMTKEELRAGIDAKLAEGG